MMSNENAEVFPMAITGDSTVEKELIENLSQLGNAFSGPEISKRESDSQFTLYLSKKKHDQLKALYELAKPNRMSVNLLDKKTQLTFSSFDEALNYYEHLRDAGFSPFERINPYTHSNEWFFEIPSSNYDLCLKLKKYFRKQKTHQPKTQAITPDEFLNDHKNILGSTDYPHHVLQNDLKAIYENNFPAQDKIQHMRALILEFKTIGILETSERIPELEKFLQALENFSVNPEQSTFSETPSQILNDFIISVKTSFSLGVHKFKLSLINEGKSIILLPEINKLLDITEKNITTEQILNIQEILKKPVEQLIENTPITPEQKFILDESIQDLDVDCKAALITLRAGQNLSETNMSDNFVTHSRSSSSSSSMTQNLQQPQPQSYSTSSQHDPNAFNIYRNRAWGSSWQPHESGSSAYQTASGGNVKINHSEYYQKKEPEQELEKEDKKQGMQNGF